MPCIQGWTTQKKRSTVPRLAETDYARIAGPASLFRRAVSLIRNHGLTDGSRLDEWIESLLDNAPAPARVFGELDRRLQVVACDITHSRLVVLPDDVGLYQDESGEPLRPDDFPIATAVRISSGYPYFFAPVRLRDRATGKEGVMVDGGVASSFPIFLFDRENPRHPTWGFRLYSGMGAEEPSTREIGGLNWPVDMAWGILDTAMNAFDHRDLAGFGDRAVAVPTGGVDTLDFTLTSEQKEFLYRSGHEAARAFFATDPSGKNSLGHRPVTI